MFWIKDGICVSVSGIKNFQSLLICYHERSPLVIGCGYLPQIKAGSAAKTIFKWLINWFMTAYAVCIFYSFHHFRKYVISSTTSNIMFGKIRNYILLMKKKYVVVTMTNAFIVLLFNIL